MIWVWLIASLLLAIPAHAKNLYVNNSGSPACSNATTYANNDAANPWCLIGRAAWGSTNPASPVAGEAAAAGDIVLVTAGTYTTIGTRTVGAGCPGGGRWEVALNPANSGTSGNLITFRAVGTVLVLLDSGYVGPTLGANVRNYIQWEGFTLNDATAGNNSCIDGALLTFHESVGSKAIRNSITGTTKSEVSANNYSAIRLEATTNITVQNNSLQSFHDSACSSNCTGITLYECENAIIDHNAISDVPTGIYVKGDAAADGWPQLNTTIRFNRISADDHGIGLYAANTTKIYQNIITSAHGIHLYNQPTPYNDNITIQNNVLYSSNLGEDIALWYSGTSNVGTLRAYNNIVYGAWAQALTFGADGLGSQDYEHNIYYNYTDFGSVSGSTRTFAYWQGTVGEDSVSPAGITSDPLFVDTTDYRLQGGSPAINLGVDVLDLDGDSSTTDNVNAGAYITGNETIGVEVASSGTSVISGNVTFSGSVRIQ